MIIPGPVAGLLVIEVHPLPDFVVVGDVSLAVIRVCRTSRKSSALEYRAESIWTARTTLTVECSQGPLSGRLETRIARLSCKLE